MSSWTDKAKKTETQKVDLIALMDSLDLNKAADYMRKAGRRTIETYDGKMQGYIFNARELEEEIATTAFAQKHGLDIGEEKLKTMIFKYVNEMALFDVATGNGGTNLSGIREYEGAPLTPRDDQVPESEVRRFNLTRDRLEKKINDYVQDRGANTGMPG